MAQSGQGYRLSLYFDSDPFDFENCDVSVDSEEVDTTGSLVVDEATGEVYGFNGSTDLDGGTDLTVGAFTDRSGGPQTLTISFSGTMRNPLVLSYLAALKPGDKLTGQDYTVYYNGELLYTGVGVYVRSLRVGAVVRGAATVSFTLVSTQYGFIRNSALAL